MLFVLAVSQDKDGKFFGGANVGAKGFSQLETWEQYMIVTDSTSGWWGRGGIVVPGLLIAKKNDWKKTKKVINSVVYNQMTVDASLMLLS